ncbi:MAG: SCO family protein [Streptosporangiaceae bacterium]
MQVLPRPPIRPEFTLVDHHGRLVTAGDYAGRWAVVFFGFTSCKAIRPRALTRIADVLDQLGPAAERVHALYVTVDPERDTPEVMRRHLAEHHPRFVGLTGSTEQIEEAKRSFRVFAVRKSDPDDPEGYRVPHSAIVYVVDPDGRYRTHFTDSYPDDERVAALRELLHRRAATTRQDP